PLSAYKNTNSFTVSWAPDAGVTDIASYTIQYNAGAAGWTNWLVDTTATSGTFVSTGQGVYAFRSNATDRAGNFEITAGNDTWTLVDTGRPFSHTLKLPTYETSLTFPVYWGPQFDTLDIASYRVQWQDDSGPWTDLAGYTNTTATSASFVGQGAHVYAFRTMARDRAGNVEPTPAVNDTWTLIDVINPFVTDTRPIGADTN